MTWNPEKEQFFARMDDLELALTYDDVRMRTQAGDDAPLPDAIDLSSRFSRNVELKIPFVSAAMDTVTESEMAIAMAKLGGLGVIHAALDPDEQRRQVRAVKLEMNGLISSPICVRSGQTVESVLNEHGKRNFRTFPVVDADGKCVGIITQNDFDFCLSPGSKVKKNMTPISDLVTSGPKTTLKQAFQLMKRHSKKTLPLINKDGTIAGMYLWSDVKRVVRENSGLYNVDDTGQLRVAAAVPTNPQALERVRAMAKYLDVAVLDSADGDSYYAFQTLELLKSEFPNIDVVVGNISDGESARKLAEAGADGIKVGQGPGSICTTRRETGIGMPQVTAGYECVRAAEERDVPVCFDGGIRYNGDIPIAFAAGAESIMMGSMLAGTDEAPGEIVLQKDGSRGKRYRGMGSASALRESAASRQRYADNPSDMPLPEGVDGTVAYKGSVEGVVGDALKALRKGMRYVKAPDIATHRHQTRLRRITHAGLTESHPHDVNIVG